ncbi:undecaprenyldiphospho-muramoylpentapeptide beta-N-acetylglucosaminyltransferase [Persicobacter psychrovividus]|uniref:UDP-N-acetylglucosamine--N-acetylmuramyl-(pentapeptide) pyrophosphoryl-undecaprenol N-acetylglucosamine transferase n=1 Tax=Persicobacter psychrovividus TaxID=387638 RepID=A0ABM7VER5_9BACT|nr:UDP-N-acetylglucosamine--N-acetylmuramyl-(pentapeptide) pyrophosphoryl-undecaprenol N-acetylglucosamine transferase [Persicobacter psychrovividus]
MNQSTPLERVIISGGGTGGHIYPAIAIANEIKKRNPKVSILFVGAQGRMEMTKVPEAGYKIEGLWISGIQRKLTLDNLAFPFKLISSMMKAKRIIKDFKPQVAIGVGGYASGPLLKMATRMNIPTLIQEQNAFAGLTNKWLADKVDAVCVATPNMERFFPKEKIVITGNPVRSDIIGAESKREAGLAHFGLSATKPVLLILGGSLGARTINETMLQDVNKYQQAGVQVLWQIGKFYFSNIQAQLSQMDTAGIHPHEFIREMDLAYASADVVISRAGALSVSELCLVGKPTVFVPSPNVSEDHQTQNALQLVNVNAALMVKDVEAKQSLATVTLDLLADAAKQQALGTAIKAQGRPSATADIVDQVERIIES